MRLPSGLKKGLTPELDLYQAQTRVEAARVDAALFRPRADSDLGLPRPVFLNVGRLAVEKNIEAFLSLDLPGTKVVVGAGPARETLMRRYPQAVFLGQRQGEELACIYAAADVFVFPSRTDTFGLVLLEALASGLPVAAFPAAAPRDVIATAAAIATDSAKTANPAVTHPFTIVAFSAA